MRVISVARKPLDRETPTVAMNILRFGTGALNVNACRVGRLTETSPMGRWPTNMILVHHKGCTQAGTTRIRVPGADNDTKKKNADGGGGVVSWGHQENGTFTHTRRDADGMETVVVWDCEPGCPVLDLDTQAEVNAASRSTVGTHASRFFKYVVQEKE